MFINARAVHHDVAFWKDPYVFRPERFLNPSGSLLPPDDETRRRLLSFGGGPRACPGESVALTRLFVAAASVVQRFHLEPDPTRPLVPCDPRTYGLGLVLCPQDYTVCFVPRRQPVASTSTAAKVAADRGTITVAAAAADRGTITAEKCECNGGSKQA